MMVVSELKQFRKAQPKQQGNFMEAIKSEEARRNPQMALATIKKVSATAPK